MRPHPVYRFRGFVIRRQNYREADRIITFFTREKGRVRCLAKGVRNAKSRRAGYLEVFSEIQGMMVSGASLNILGEITGVSQFPPASSLEAVSHAYYACEIVDRLTPEEEPHPEIYRLFAAVIADLVSVPEQSYPDLISGFTVRTLTLLGYLPEKGADDKSQLVALLEKISERKIITPRFIAKIRKA